MITRPQSSELSHQVSNTDGKRDDATEQQVCREGRTVPTLRAARVGVSVCGVGVSIRAGMIGGRDQLRKELRKDGRLSVEGVGGDREATALGERRLNGADRPATHVERRVVTHVAVVTRVCVACAYGVDSSMNESTPLRMEETDQAGTHVSGWKSLIDRQRRVFVLKRPLRERRDVQPHVSRPRVCGVGERGERLTWV